MDVLEAIKTRRSFGLVKDEAVPESLIEQILEAGTWAPSHFRTEPWRFFVLVEEGRKQLAEVFVKIAEKNGEADAAKLDKELKKPYRAPVVIAVAAEPATDPKVVQLEEYGAVYACIQNMFLAAHSLGLAGYWRTGAPTYDPLMKEFFGLSENGEVLGFLYIGYPKRALPEGKRNPFQNVTKWIR
ncbi:nitroreductase [Bacillus sp. FJAT-18017]|uniref:nitroreductase family protein n=1 Tax=Bacillus sp. FJAT-18017 TaxID=1705566 RepID=UPI0006B001B0|nr:nitroreductase [Bacillus sp. FJAT-18017]ALC91757.1 nitroreductase [Bacillus sp. FJAT-18017]